jgi:hypothetical protein
MKNLTRLTNREDKWYKIGPVTLPMGVPKRTPFYFLATLGASFLIGKIPYSPIWLINQINGGWGFSYILLPAISTAFLQLFQKGGKKPERYLLSMVNFWLHPKRVNPYQTLEKPTTYIFGSTYTIRLEERKEEADEKIGAVSDPAHRGEPGIHAK